MKRTIPANLYVANLPPEMQAEELAALFDSFGHVLLARLAVDARTGAPRGYGFVDLAPAAAVDRAIEQLNGQRVHGRAIVVGRARPPRKTERPSAPPPQPRARLALESSPMRAAAPRAPRAAAGPVVVMYKSRFKRA